MTLFMIVAVGALFVVWIVTGVKMLIMASRTRSVPELLLGLALLLEAGVGYPMTAVAPITGPFEVPLKMIGSAISDAGTICLLLFTVRVFRETDRRAWAFVGAMAALLAVHTIGYSIDLAQVTTPETLLARLLYWGAWSLALTGIAWGQTGFESLRYYALLRRRVALGLADAGVANRVLLWALMGLTALACVLVDTALLYSGSAFARDVLLPTVTALAGIAVSAYMVLAFWPPAAYLAWVRRAPAEPR